MNESTGMRSGISRSQAQLSPPAREFLRRMAVRYVWWKSPQEAMQFPERVAAQVMNIGDWNDAVELVETAGEEYLRRVLRDADAGQLNARSWHYWHYRLGLAEYGVRPVPPRPMRRLT
jgi:hypothetical protein